MRFRKLPRSFYERPALTVARDLLGKLFVRRLRGTLLTGRIVEVEAYLGSIDPASHTYRGRTERNDVMFWGGGFLYVYFIYGMHFCANVVTGPEGKGHAVLIRALEPLEGIPGMARNRHGRSDSSMRSLTSGPAKLCEALAIRRRENGTDLLGSSIFLAQDSWTPAERIVRTTRIGIRAGSEKRWRFYISGNSFVSKP